MTYSCSISRCECSATALHPVNTNLLDRRKTRRGPRLVGLFQDSSLISKRYNSSTNIREVRFSNSCSFQESSHLSKWVKLKVRQSHGLANELFSTRHPTKPWSSLREHRRRESGKFCPFLAWDFQKSLKIPCRELRLHFTSTCFWERPISWLHFYCTSLLNLFLPKILTSLHFEKNSQKIVIFSTSLLTSPLHPPPPLRNLEKRPPLSRPPT